MNKKKLIWICSIICLISLVVPFFFRDKETTLLGVLSVAFTALSATATVSTLLIAILLYERFSIDSILVERQTNKVIELIDFLKGQTVKIDFDKYTYYSRFDIDNINLYNSEFYKAMAGFALVTRVKDYDSFFGKIVDMSYSYWMPEEIKEKMQFLKITGYFKEVPQSELKNYAKLKFSSKESKEDEWLIITPNLKEFSTGDGQVIKLEDAELLVNDYIASKNMLINTIVNWLEEKSNIKLDFKLYEPNQSIEMK
jgi:hypothetical protein